MFGNIKYSADIMLRHIARVLWFRENKACVGLSSGSRTNACMPDD